MADTFFDRYPKGLCLFLLVGGDKSIIFGPDFEYPIFELDERIVHDLRQSLREQIFYLKSSDTPKTLYIFYCERTDYPANEALTAARAFKKFLNKNVFNDNFCSAAPIHLKEVSYKGYSGGTGVDKKKDFAFYIKERQDGIDNSPRQRVTLEVVTPEDLAMPLASPGDGETIYFHHEAQTITETVYQRPNPGLAIGCIIAAIVTYVPLLILSIRK